MLPLGREYPQPLVGTWMQTKTTPQITKNTHTTADIFLRIRQHLIPKKMTTVLNEVSRIIPSLSETMGALFRSGRCTPGPINGCHGWLTFMFDGDPPLWEGSTGERFPVFSSVRAGKLIFPSPHVHNKKKRKGTSHHRTHSS